MQVDLYNGRKMVVALVFSQSVYCSMIIVTKFYSVQHKKLPRR